MAVVSSISWCHATWNPWQGCQKVSAECARCYMFRDKARYGQDPSRVVRSKPGTFRLPLARHGARSTKGTPGEYKIPAGSRVFTCSWSDWFHPNADDWRADAWDVIRQRPDLVFLVLTKRADRIASHLPPDWGTEGYPNVWLGVTCGIQSSLHRVEALGKVPAVVRFVSAGPLLGRVDFGDSLNRVDWLITEGESGPGARPMDPRWASYALSQGRRSGCAIHHKQNGEWAPIYSVSAGVRRRIGDWTDAQMKDRARLIESGRTLYRVGVASAGRSLAGRVYDEFPTPRGNW